MSDVQGTADQKKPRVCERCGSRMPPQRRGRPRRWCTQQCRQKAYEERRGLTSWADRQPKVTDLSEVVEISQDRAASESARRSAARTRQPSESTHDCTFAIWQDQVEMSIIVDHVADLVAHQAFRTGPDGRLLLEAVARLVDAVDLITMRVVRMGDPLRPTPEAADAYGQSP